MEILNSELLRQKLKEINKTYKRIEIETGLSYSVIEKVFRGKITNPTSKVILPICQSLGIKLEDLMLNSEKIKDSTNVYIIKNGITIGYTLNNQNFETIEMLLKKFSKEEK